jgi:Ser/Thr protein kinase RdoA (MazF antagonist)
VTSVEAVLAERFGLGTATSLDEVARGAMGAVWRLRTDKGTFAAKELFWSEPDEAAIECEVTFRSACAEAGVPSPMPLATTCGAYVVNHGDDRWRVHEWAYGDVPDQWDVATTSWLAAQMAAIHAIEWSGEATDPEPWYHQIDADWAGLVDAAEEAGVGWAAGLRRSVPELRELTELVNSTPVGDMVWCHRDLKNTNVLRSAGSSWLVDWDNVGPLAPERELGALLMAQLAQPANLRRIVAAYRKAGGTAEIDGPAGFATGLAVSLNYLQGQASAAMDTGLVDHHRHFAASQVPGLLDSLPDLALLEQAAHAAR